jgi:hypothetical protein
MNHEQRLKIYEYLNTLDGERNRYYQRMQCIAFLSKYPNIRDMINSHAYHQCHSGGEEETVSYAKSLALDIYRALVKDGLPDVTEQEILLEIYHDMNKHKGEVQDES